MKNGKKFMKKLPFTRKKHNSSSGTILGDKHPKEKKGFDETQMRSSGSISAETAERSMGLKVLYISTSS